MPSGPALVPPLPPRAFGSVAPAFPRPRHLGRTPFYLGIGAGAVVLAGVCILATMWATGFFAQPRAEEHAKVQDADEKPAAARPDEAKPKTEPDRKAPAKTEPKSEPSNGPAQPAAPAAAAFRPEAGHWLGVIEEGQFNPILVEFQVSEDGQKIEALMLGCNLSPWWLATSFTFPEMKRGDGEFKAKHGGSELTLAFVTSTEARGQAKVHMEILKKPGLERTNTVVSGEFAAKPRRWFGGVLGGGANPLAGKWHCTTPSFETMSLEFKDDGTGTATYKTNATSFTYLFHPKSRRVDIRGAGGDCELTAEGRLSASLRFSFTDVLKPGFPTINVDVKGQFTREGSGAAKPAQPK